MQKIRNILIGLLAAPLIISAPLASKAQESCQCWSSSQIVSFCQGKADMFWSWSGKTKVGISCANQNPAFEIIRQGVDNWTCYTNSADSEQIIPSSMKDSCIADVIGAAIQLGDLDNTGDDSCRKASAC